MTIDMGHQQVTVINIQPAHVQEWSFSEAPSPEAIRDPWSCFVQQTLQIVFLRICQVTFEFQLVSSLLFKHVKIHTQIIVKSATSYKILM